MAEITIVGKLLDKPEERDAIHIAVAPVIAGNVLRPGMHIGFATDGDTDTVSCFVQPFIGIVDPFLMRPVEVGERFWMFLYPNTITSLKHQWTHPAFGPEEVKRKGDVAASEQWLRDFVANANCPRYDTLIAAAVGDHDKNYGEDGYMNSRNDGEFLHFGGLDAHGEIPPEFWEHVEVVTGKKITKRPTYFSCSC